MARPALPASARRCPAPPVEWAVVPDLTIDQRRSLERVRDDSASVQRLSTAFAAAGHELYLVGGPVRDALLGRLGNDLDFTTSARPDEIERLLRRFSHSVWDIGKEFGTIGCLAREPDGREFVIEVTTFRSDVYSADSRKPRVRFGDHLGGDLVRRDFTVNAMALSLPDGELLDPFGGVADLEARCCAPRPRRSCRSATTRCGCCARPGSPPSWTSVRPSRWWGRCATWPNGSRSCRPSACATS